MSHQEPCSMEREPRTRTRSKSMSIRANGAVKVVAGFASLLAAVTTAHAQPAPISVVEPNDPGVPSQWHLADERPGIGAFSAWAMLRDVPQQEVSVAVIDTNIELWNKDLSTRLVTGWDARNQRPYGNSYLIGSSLHGTLVAGTMVAESGNGYLGSGVAGPLPVKLMPLKYVNQDDLCATSLKPGAEAEVGRAFADSLAFALTNGARVINISSAVLMTPEVASMYEPYLKAARAQGVLVVGAAGNIDLDMRRLATESVVGVTLRDLSVPPSDAPCDTAGKRTGLRYETALNAAERALWVSGTTDQVTLDGKTYERSIATVYARGTKSYPAAYGEAPFHYDNVVGVTGSNQSGTRWLEDCTFPDGRPVLCAGATYGDHASLVAPSDDILVYSGLGLGTSIDGTSFGAPMVSAAAAMLWSVQPDLTPQQVIAALGAGTNVAAVRDGKVSSADVLSIPRALSYLGFTDPLAPRRFGELSPPTWNVEQRRDDFVDDVTFDPNGYIVERIWDWGDGSFTTRAGDETTASHAYAFKGDYPVTLTVIDNDGHSLSFTRKLAAHGASRDLVTLTLDGADSYTLDGMLQSGNIRNAIYIPNQYVMRGAGTLQTAAGEVTIEVDIKTGWFARSPKGTITIDDPQRGRIVVSMTSGTRAYDKDTDTLTFSQDGLTANGFSSVSITVRDTDD